MDIMEKLYTNSLVIDFPKDDPEIMYENIDTCWGICSFCPSYTGDEQDTTALLLGRMWRLSGKWTGY